MIVQQKMKNNEKKKTLEKKEVYKYFFVGEVPTPYAPRFVGWGFVPPRPALVGPPSPGRFLNESP